MVGPLLAAVCSLLSVFVVLRGMAMISEGVAHSGVGGLGVALLVGLLLPALDNSIGQLILTGVFCTATALLIGYVSHGKNVSEDSAIGIFLVASVSVGICALTIRQYIHGAGGSPPSLEDMLFGTITTVGPADVYATLAVAAAVFAVVFSMYSAFVYTALDEEMARINGVPVGLINTLLLLMVSVVIVMAMRMVGLFMINALMIIPGATARLMSRSFAGGWWRNVVAGGGGGRNGEFIPGGGVVLVAAAGPDSHRPNFGADSIWCIRGGVGVSAVVQGEGTAGGGVKIELKIYLAHPS